MLRELSVAHCSHPLVAPFRISRGTKHAADVVTVELRQDGRTGRGESVPYGRYGESVASVIAQVEALRTELAAGMGRDELQARLPPGAARNALDTALWDLDSRLTSVPVSAQLARTAPSPVVTAITLGIDTPENMARAAARIVDEAGVGLVKIKLDADIGANVARLEAVRRAAPGARLIVDPNESWDIHRLRGMQPALERAGVDLLEQPLPAGADDDLADWAGPIPVCADEACHVASDLPRLRGRYRAVNIKLDKTGGLTEAWRLLHAARDAGFQIMVGCMICSSLGIAPALEIAREAAFVDLDGPFWLKSDHPGGATLQGGRLQPPAAGFWGG
jgi:L-alanine-DL-glutamate epimerase-like enolase superfamily enzyme